MTEQTALADQYMGPVLGSVVAAAVTTTHDSIDLADPTDGWGDTAHSGDLFMLVSDVDIVVGFGRPVVVEESDTTAIDRTDQSKGAQCGMFVPAKTYYSFRLPVDDEGEMSVLYYEGYDAGTLWVQLSGCARTENTRRY